MPAEWEEHQATWLAWPNDADYFGDRIENIKKIYLEIIFNLHKNEVVKLLVLNENEEYKIKILMKERGIDLAKIIFFQAKYVDVWMRDYGPIFVKKDNELSWVKFNYDGYGGKFSELLPDNDIFLTLKDKIKLEMFRSEMVLEGGAIDSNGIGAILTTKECLLKNRNLEKSGKDNNDILKEYLGATNIIWLENGLVNDHTDGHVDEVARFVGPNKILCAYEDDINNENYKRLNENYEILQNSKDQNGNAFDIIKLPMPHMKYDEGEKDFHGKQAPASYTNFYIANQVVLVSVFNDQNDEVALGIIKSCFPDREVVGINATDLIYGGGAIHCITEQEPL